MLTSGTSTRISWLAAVHAISNIFIGALCSVDNRTSCSDRDILPSKGKGKSDASEIAPVITETNGKENFLVVAILIRFTCVTKLLEEIHGYAPVVNSIIHAVVHGSERNKTYEDLALFVDFFGARYTGTAALERSIDYMVKLLKRRRLDNVHTEPARVPRWVRGSEAAWIVAPRLHKLPILGLGYSAPTPRRGITAPILVVDSLKELQENRHKAAGKIVVFNQKFTSYEKTSKYRKRGPEEAAKAGAVAVLVRSLTPFSIATLHTGWTTFTNRWFRIPSASITVEDAELLKRLQNRGTTPVIKLIMRNRDLPAVISRNTVAEITGNYTSLSQTLAIGCQYQITSYRGTTPVIKLIMRNRDLPAVISRNTVAEITGWEKPREVVIISGHIDSWDVGQGAMDDGGGAFISWRALDVFRRLGLQPRRTVRSVLWTAEEVGIKGAEQYFADHADERKERINIAMESDTGTFKPKGLAFSGHSERAKCVIAEVLSLFSNIDATELTIGADAPDLSLWIKAGFPVASLTTHNGRYFYFHHTDGDTMTVHDAKVLDLCTAMWAGVSYILADLHESLPRR